MKHCLNVTEDAFDQEIIKSEIPVLVDFWAPWCGPCKAIGPSVEKIAEEYSGRLKVVKINVEENRSIAASMGIKGIPAIFTFRSGNVFDQHIGSPPNALEKLRQMADNVLA